MSLAVNPCDGVLLSPIVVVRSRASLEGLLLLKFVTALSIIPSVNFEYVFLLSMPDLLVFHTAFALSRVLLVSKSFRLFSIFPGLPRPSIAFAVASNVSSVAFS